MRLPRQDFGSFETPPAALVKISPEYVETPESSTGRARISTPPLSWAIAPFMLPKKAPSTRRSRISEKINW
jgi:hypothetical protein